MSGAVDTLHEAIDAATDIDLDTLTDVELDDELVGLLRLRHRLDAEIARRADRWDRRTIWRGDGSKAPWARLCRTTSIAPNTARGILRRGHAVTAMPATAEAWASGELGADHVDLLADAASNGRGDLFARDETMLVNHCLELTWGQVIKAVRYWTFRADTELNRDGTPPSPPNSLRITTTFDGTVSGDFILDPIGGATFTEALRRIERDLYRTDQRDGIVRTMQERMAAALVEMAVRSHTAPKDGRRPEPLVCILAGEATIEHLCELSTGLVIAPDLVVPHLGRSQVQTFIFDGADRVIAASPARTFRGMLRRAIQVHDRHCQHQSGCDEPITHCDVNHRMPVRRGWRHRRSRRRPGVRVTQPPLRPPRRSTGRADRRSPLAPRDGSTHSPTHRRPRHPTPPTRSPTTTTRRLSPSLGAHPSAGRPPECGVNHRGSWRTRERARRAAVLPSLTHRPGRRTTMQHAR